MKRKFVLIIILIGFLVVVVSCFSKRTSANKNNEVKTSDKSQFDYLYVEALKQKMLGNSGEALKYLEKCISLSPSSDAAFYQIAQIIIASGDITNAKRYAFKAYSIDSRNIWYVNMLSGIYYQQGNIDSAIIIYEKAITDFPQKQNLFITLAGLYNEKNDYTKSINLYRKLEEKYGINENTTPGFIQSLALEGKYDDALLKVNELIAAFPSGIQYYTLLAEIYRHKGDTVKAEEVYKKVLTENPGNPQILMSATDFLITEKKFEELFILLNSVIISNEIKKEEKISLFARLIEIKYDNPDHINNLLLTIMVLESSYENDFVIGLLRPEFLSNIGRISEAIKRLEELTVSEPNNYYAFEKLLLLYLQQQEYVKLYKYGEVCATRFNRSFIAKILYATAATELRKFDVANEELRKAEILAGDNTDYLTQVLTMKADLYYKEGEFTKAYETFDQALIINKDDLTILNNYAYYLAEQNTNLKKAEEMATKVIEKEKNNDTFLDTYAWVIYKRGNAKDAAVIMSEILSRQSSNAEYFEHYGFILKELNKCNKAIEYWNKAILADSTKVFLKKEIDNCK